MLIIKTNQLNTLVVTVSQNAELSNPQWLFSFTHIFTKDKVSFVLPNTSSHQNRYDEFVFTEGQAAGQIAFPFEGQYLYTVSEQVAQIPTNTNPALAYNVVENGLALVIATSAETTNDYYVEFISSNEDNSNYLFAPDELNPPSPTPSVTATQTQTPFVTSTSSPTTTPTPSITASQTNTPTPSITASETPSATPTLTPTNTTTQTNTPTNTSTPTNTPTPSITASQTMTATPSVTPTNTATPTNTITPTNTPTPSITASQTMTATPSVTPTNTATPTSTPTPSITASQTMTPSPSVTATQTNTPSMTQTQTSTPTPSITASPTLTTTPTPSPTRPAFNPSSLSPDIWVDFSDSSSMTIRTSGSNSFLERINNKGTDVSLTAYTQTNAGDQPLIKVSTVFTGLTISAATVSNDWLSGVATISGFSWTIVYVIGRKLGDGTPQMQPSRFTWGGGVLSPYWMDTSANSVIRNFSGSNATYTVTNPNTLTYTGQTYLQYLSTTGATATRYIEMNASGLTITQSGYFQNVFPAATSWLLNEQGEVSNKQGEVGEILMLRRELTSTEKTNLYNYLRIKWGLTY
jgi:hypothetical protein